MSKWWVKCPLLLYCLLAAVSRTVPSLTWGNEERKIRIKSRTCRTMLKTEASSHQTQDPPSDLSWDGCDSRRKMRAPPNSLCCLQTGLGWRETKPRLWGRKGIRMDECRESQEMGALHTLQRPKRCSCLQHLTFWEPGTSPVSRSTRLSPGPADSRARHNDTSAFDIIHFSQDSHIFSPQIAVSWEAKPSSHWTGVTSARRSSRSPKPCSFISLQAELEIEMLHPPHTARVCWRLRGNKPSENKPNLALSWKCWLQPLWAHDERDVLCLSSPRCTLQHVLGWRVHSTHPMAAGYDSTFFSKCFPSLTHIRLQCSNGT